LRRVTRRLKERGGGGEEGLDVKEVTSEEKGAIGDRKGERVVREERKKMGGRGRRG